MNRYIWATAGLLVVGTLLVSLITALLPFLLIGAVLVGIYSFVFKKRW